MEALSEALMSDSVALMSLVVIMLAVCVVVCLFFSNDSEVSRLHDEIKDLRDSVDRLSKEVVRLRKFAHVHHGQEPENSDPN